MSKNEKAVDKFLDAMGKKYGKDAIMPLDYSEKADFNDGVISTGCVSLDYITGIGGIPRGRIVEIFGGESSGKTTLALHLTRSAQKNDGKVAYIDTENALDVKYAKNLGVDLDRKRFFLTQPESGEEALNQVIDYAKSKLVDLIIVDSVAGLTPQKELDGEMQNEQMGLMARMIGKGMRKLKSIVKKNKCAIVMINQTREKIGIMFGDKVDTPGGKSLKFFSSMRLQIGRLSTFKIAGKATGNVVKVTIKKNKCAAPFGTTEFHVLYGIGIDKNEDVVNFLINNKCIEKKEGKYKIGKIGSFKSVDEIKDHIEKDKKFRKEIFKMARSVK